MSERRKPRQSMIDEDDLFDDYFEEDYDDEFEEDDVLDGANKLNLRRPLPIVGIVTSIVVACAIIFGVAFAVRSSIRSTQLAQARTCMAKGAYEEAVSCCKKVVAVDKKSVEGYSMLIQAYIGAKMYDEGYQAILDAIEHTKDATFTVMKDAYYPKLELSLEPGDYKGAQTIELLTNPEDKVYYTTDGSTPKPGDVLTNEAEDGEIILDVGEWELCVISVSQFGVQSEVKGGEYTVVPIVVKMPDLSDLTEKKAIKKLKKLGLVPDITYEEVLTKEDGLVIEQEIEAGTKLDYGTHVAIVVGKKMEIIEKYRQYIDEHYTLSRCHVILADVTHSGALDCILLVNSKTGYTMHVFTMAKDQVTEVLKEYCDADMAYGYYRDGGEDYLFRYSESKTPVYEVFSVNKDGSKSCIHKGNYEKIKVTTEEDESVMDDSADAAQQANKDNKEKFNNELNRYASDCEKMIVNTTKLLSNYGEGCLLGDSYSVSTVLGEAPKEE